MTDMKKTLDRLADPIKEAIEKDYAKKLEEITEKAYDKAKNELNNKYTTDKEILEKAAAKLIDDAIEGVVKDLKESAIAHKEAAKKYNEAIKANEEFVKSTIEAEMKEMKESYNKIDSSLNSFDAKIKEAISESVIELENEKNQYISARADILAEGRQLIEEQKKTFLKEATLKAADWIENVMTDEITELKEDIEEARKNSFGTRIFEMFAPEFKAAFLNENKEYKVLLKEIHDREEHIKAKEEELKESAAIIAEKERLILESRNDLKIERDLRKREAILSENCIGLSIDKRRILEDMVKDVETTKLAEAIKQYIPFVMKPKNTVKQMNESTLSSRKVITGNRKIEKPTTNTTVNVKKDDELDEIAKFIELAQM